MDDGALIGQFREKMAAWGARFICDTTCNRFRDRSLGLAYEVWREHAGPDGVARQKDLTPRVMQPFLKKVALFERVDQSLGPQRWRARLTGQEFTLAYAEMSGKYLDEVLSRPFLLRWKALGDLVLAWGKPIRYLTVTEAFNRDNSVLEHLMVPLLNGNNKLTHVLMVCNFERGAHWNKVAAEEAQAGCRVDGPPLHQ